MTDIRDKGLLRPVVRHEGKVLDGRNRLAACILADVEPTFRDWQGEGGSPTAFVVSENLKRRFLSAAQRAMIGREALPLLEAEAKVRQAVGVKNLKHQKETPEVDVIGCGNVATTDKTRRKRTNSKKSREIAAATVGVSPRSIQHAKTVTDEGIPDLAEAVKEDKIKVSTAAAIAKLPEEQQEAVIAAVNAGAKPTEALKKVTEVEPPQDETAAATT